MNDKELALEIMKIYSEKQKSLEWWHCVDFYHKILEEIRKYKSETTLGKLEEFINDYDSRYTYSEFERGELIDKFRKYVKGEKE